MSGAHGGLQGGEALVEGAEDGDHGVRNSVALAQACAHEERTGLQQLDLAGGTHGRRDLRTKARHGKEARGEQSAGAATLGQARAAKQRQQRAHCKHAGGEGDCSKP